MIARRALGAIRLGGSLVFLTLAVLVPSALGNVPASGPADVVREASERLLEVIRAGESQFDSDPDGFYRAVAETLESSVDFEGIARLVMATYYRKASEAQRQRFAEVFKWGLVRTYAKALMDFDDVELEVMGSAPGRRPNRATVKMRATSKDGRSYPMEYSMVQTSDGRWLMRNLVINGVNLGLTYRNQFASAMRSPENRGNIDRVIDHWSAVIDTIDGAGSEDGAS